MEIDGKKITGTVKEKEEAKNNYDDAIAEGHGGFLLEQSKFSNNLTPPLRANILLRLQKKTKYSR